MAKQLQVRRGTTMANNLFTGAEGEITMDTVEKGLRIHDGSLRGGYRVPTLVAVQYPSVANNYTWYRKYSDGWVEQGGIQTGAGSYGTVAITLPVAMADNNYQVFANMRNLPNIWYTNNTDVVSLASATDVAGTATNVSTTGFEIQRHSPHTWYVCGMAA